jgi:hypothetical protein
MAEGGAGVRMVVMGLCLGATALGLANTYGDNAEVVKLAETAACGAPGCSLVVTRQARSPLSQAVTFQVSVTERGRERSATADVTCKRAYVLLGDYACVLTSGGLPRLSPSSSPSR